MKIALKLLWIALLVLLPQAACSGPFGPDYFEYTGEKAAAMVQKEFKDLPCQFSQVFYYAHRNGFPADPSMYYRFTVDKGCIDGYQQRYGFKAIDKPLPEILQTIRPNRNWDWWQPEQVKQYIYLEGRDDEGNNDYYLLYDTSLQLCFLYIQNG